MPAKPPLTKHARSFCSMRRNCIHERRGQTIIGLQAKLRQPGPDRAHVIRIGPRLNYGGDKCREFRRCPAFILRQLGMNEIKAEERMLLIVDASVHMHAALPAGVSLDSRARVHDL